MTSNSDSNKKTPDEIPSAATTETNNAKDTSADLENSAADARRARLYPL